MSNLELVPLKKDEIEEFKLQMKKSFQLGAEGVFESDDAEILPEKDIDNSLNTKGSVAYKAIVDGEMVGGAIVLIDPHTHNNSLEFLFIKSDVQNKGYGKKIWENLENIYPNTKIWTTFTPYFDKRNIHFYINVCGFSIVEFFNPFHKQPSIKDETLNQDLFFRFEKKFKLL